MASSWDPSLPLRRLTSCRARRLLARSAAESSHERRRAVTALSRREHAPVPASVL